MKKLLISFGVAAVLAATAVTQAGAAGAEQVMTAPVKSFEGKVDIGGYSLYINSQGKGKPTVVFDSGYGDSSDVWQQVQSATSEFAQAVRYDRAGMGQSDLSPKARTSVEKVIEMRTLLQKAKVKPPYILVGHSLGGVHARVFAEMYPDEVAGIVLVDSGHEDQIERFIGLLPPEFKEMFEGQFNTPDGNYQDIITSLDQARAARASLRDVPMTVLSSQNIGLGDEITKAWLEMQQDLASLSTRSKWVLAEQAGHYIHTEEPELVVGAIREMVETKWK